MDNKGIGAIPGGFVMTSKRTLVIPIAWAFLIVCILIVDALLPGQPSIGAASREQFRDGAELLTANPYVASTMRDFAESEVLRDSVSRSLEKGHGLRDGAAKSDFPEMNASPEVNPAVSIERKVKDAQLKMLATTVAGNILAKDDEFQVLPGDAVAWEVRLIVYNMRASTGWRYWDARLEFGPELSVEALDGPGTIDPIPEGGSSAEPTLAIMRDEKTRKAKVEWSWHSLEDNTSSDFPKRAQAEVRLRVCPLPESGYEPGIFVFCDNARITYMTGAKRPKETTYELEPIVVNVTSL
jgi:hypothetical protein